MRDHKTEHTFCYEDFNDPDGVSLRLGIPWGLIGGELLCDVSYYPIRGYPNTRWEPGEPSHIEDIQVFFEGTDITEELSPVALDILTELLMEEEFDDPGNN